jgi:hypothetical protein
MQHSATFAGLRARRGVCPLMACRSDAARGRWNARISREICRRRPAYAGACQRFLRDGRSTKISPADIILCSTDLTCLSELCQMGCNSTFSQPHNHTLLCSLGAVHLRLPRLSPFDGAALLTADTLLPLPELRICFMTLEQNVSRLRGPVALECRYGHRRCMTCPI